MNKDKNTVRAKKLTMVSINGRTRFVWADADENGKVRVGWDDLRDLFDLKRGDCCLCG